MITGVRVFFYLEDRERTLDSPTDKIMMSLTAFADELEREKARQRTYDAMQRKARAGHVTGGSVFGYRNVNVLDHVGRRDHVRREIEGDQAVVVREIFEAYAAGAGVRTIAKRLNDEQRPCPRAQRGRPSGWAPSSVWEVLHRPIYRGEIVWNQTKKRNQWGAKATSTRAEGDWIRVPAPDLRIVPEPLWQAVQERAAGARKSYLSATAGQSWGRRPNAAESPYLLTGFTKCEHCGASMVVRSRSHGAKRSFWYACSAFHHRGRSVCANSLEVRIERADDAILDDVEQFVIHPKVVGRAIELALEELRPSSGRVDQQRESLEREVAAVRIEIANLTRALAAGGDMPSLIAALQSAERRRQSTEATIAALGQTQAFTTRHAKNLEAQVLEKVAAWRSTLRQEPSEARQVLRTLIQERIALEATERDSERFYRYRGTFTIGGLFEGAIDCPQMLASPTGFDTFRSFRSRACFAPHDDRVEFQFSGAGWPSVCQVLRTWPPR